MRWIYFVLTISAVLTFTGEAEAEKRVALVVGNGTYDSWQTLSGPLQNASGMSRVLREAQFEVIERRDLSLAGIMKALEAFSDALDGADVALFYYSGRGVQIDGENLLYPTNISRQDDITSGSGTVSLRSVMNLMTRKAGVSFLFLDACAGNTPTPSRVAELSAAGLPRRVTRGLSVVPIKRRDNFAAFATTPGATDRDCNGTITPFTDALLREIPEPKSELSVLMKRVATTVNFATGGRQKLEQISGKVPVFYFNNRSAGRQSPTGQVCSVSIDLPKVVYKIGDPLEFLVTPTCPCQLGLVDFSDTVGEPEVIMPGSKESYYLTGGQILQPNQRFTIPFAKRVRDPDSGKEIAVDLTITKPDGINRIGAFCGIKGLSAMQISTFKLKEAIKLRGFEIGIRELPGSNETGNSVFTTSRSYFVQD